MRSHIFLALAACTVVFAGCASKEEPARQIVAGAEANLAPLREDAAIYAPEQLQAAENNLAEARENLTWEKYQDVLDQASGLNQSVTVLKEAVVSKQTQLAAATHEWEALSEEVPKLVQAIESQVGGLPRSKRETAKAELETMKTMWSEATAAFAAGDPTLAADKGRMVQAKGKEVIEQLGMSPV
jgi:chromosome segregation ATPase